MDSVAIEALGGAEMRVNDFGPPSPICKDLIGLTQSIELLLLEWERNHGLHRIQVHVLAGVKIESILAVGGKLWVVCCIVHDWLNLDVFIARKSNGGIRAWSVNTAWVVHLAAIEEACCRIKVI